MDRNRARNEALLAQQDRLIAQQALVRRFRLQHPQEYAALQGVRNGLITIFKEHGRSGMWRGNFPMALSYWLTTAEYRSIRKALRARDFGAVARRLAGPRQLEAWESTLEPACEFLRSQLDVLDDLLDRFNYFDYVSLLSMASLCSGSQLCSAYDGRWSLLLHCEPEHRIFLDTGVGADLEIQCAVRASTAPERFGSPSLHILDSRANPTPGIDGPDDAAIYLRIGLARAPAEIDHALQQLRATLMERLLEVHESGEIPDWEPFQESKFATAQLLPLSKLKLLHSKQQLLPLFRGFWCWDLVHSNDLPMPARRAATQVSEEVADEDGIPGPVAVHDQFERVRDLIEAKESGQRSALDKFYSPRPDVRLGLRSGG